MAYPDEAYANLSCQENGAERIRIQDSVLAATGQQRSERKKDQAVVIDRLTGILSVGPASLSCQVAQQKF